MALKKTDNVKCNEDIERERKKCSFDPLELTHLLDGGPEKTRERKERGKNTILKYLNGLVRERGMDWRYFYSLVTAALSWLLLGISNVKRDLNP
jgi:hypothetical protein